MFEELGISFGTSLIVLIALYFVIKWAVKNGIKEAYKDITWKDTAEDIEADEEEIGCITFTTPFILNQRLSSAPF